MPGNGGLGRATLTPQLIINQEVVHLKRTGDSVNPTQPHQGGFRVIATTKGVINVSEAGHIVNCDTRTYPSWWQTCPNFLQLALFDTRPLGINSGTGLLIATKPMAQT